MALAPLKKQRLLKSFATFDIETNEWLDDSYNHDSQDVIKEWHGKPIKPFLAMFYNGKELREYEGPDCIGAFLRDFLTFKNRSFITFAHNGGKFDFIALYEALRSDPYLSKHFSPKILLAHGSIMALTIIDNYKHAWHFRDSFHLLKDSLAELCKSFKPETPKIARPDVSFERARESWLEYCGRDCIALYKILGMFNDIIKEVGGSVGYTIASTAMATFRKTFLKESLDCYFEYNNVFRNAYYGGRTEIFNMYAEPGDGAFYYYDVNSEYPDIMAKNEFPISKPRSVKYRDPSEVKGKCGIMEAEILTPRSLDIPLLPYRRPDDLKLLFPLGSWLGFYEFSLIEKALSLGYEIKPLRTWEFESKPLFKGYVDTFYKIKNESSGAKKATMKFLLNSLYGKFGEHQEREELITDPSEDITGSYPYDSVYGYSIRKYERYSAHHLPAIACRITSLAQIKLYSFIEEIQKRKGKLYYTDTDSLITNVRLPTSKERGDIKLEHKIAEAVFIAPKCYALKLWDNNEKIVIKGFSRAFTKHMSFKDFRQALINNDYSKFTEYNVSPASFKEITVRKLPGFSTIVKSKEIKSEYNKRLVMADYTTRPLTINDLV